MSCTARGGDDDAAAYSNLVVLAPNKVGILFEMEDGKPYRIVWKNVKFD